MKKKYCKLEIFTPCVKKIKKNIYFLFNGFKFRKNKIMLPLREDSWLHVKRRHFTKKVSPQEKLQTETRDETEKRRKLPKKIDLKRIKCQTRCNQIFCHVSEVS